jgi:HTH-type transcriptional regulator/antitoxin HigA
MKKKITRAEFEGAEAQMELLLSKATEKVGFESLSQEENNALQRYTNIVEAYESEHYVMPMPETLQGLIALKLYEKKLKQKDLARLLNTSDTQLSEIMHKKRKPTVSLLKSLNQILEIDGNLLLKLA